MFWKLHRNNREQDMRELTKLLADFFSYAAAQGGTSLDESAFRKAFSQNAQWLLDQFHGGQKNRIELKQAVKELFQMSPARRRAIAQAVAHDMDFDSTADPSHFFFAVPSLPPEEQAVIKAFFKYFYETAFERRQGPTINGRVSGAVRSEFSQAYYQANDAMRYACPICLHPNSDATQENDLEHYFPKGVYSPLILHPFNLLFICKYCNETYKHTEDVLQAGRQPLSGVFLPYRDTVKEHAKVVIRREDNKDCVKLLALDGTVEKQKKIENFNRLYQLEKRWSSDIERMFEQTRKCCAGRNLSREELRRKLDEMCKDLQALSDFPDKFLESVYLDWLCETMFDAFYDSLQPASGTGTDDIS